MHFQSEALDSSCEGATQGHHIYGHEVICASAVYASEKKEKKPRSNECMKIIISWYRAVLIVQNDGCHEGYITLETGRYDGVCALSVNLEG